MPPGWGGWVPAPKPGVIPLAPLKLGDVFSGAFATLGKYFKHLIGLSAALYGGALLLMAVAVAVAYSAVSDTLDRMVALGYDEDPAPGDVSTLVIAGICLAVLGIATMLVVSGLMYAAVPAVVQEAVLGRAVTFAAVWRRAWAALFPVMGAVFLTALVIIVPVLLLMVALIGMIVISATAESGTGSVTASVLGILGALATAPLAVWIAIRFCLAPAVVVIEGRRPVDAMRRSAQLIRGDWWRVFGITLLVYAIAGVAGYFVQLPFMFLGMFSSVLGSASLGPEPSVAAVLVMMGGYMVAMLLGQMVSQIIVTTFPQVVTSLLYIDRRIRTEDLAPALTEAAGLPPQGHYPPPYPGGGAPRW
ncbi:glycerophosphoryl diester phosphodiesterase membrane domain-containing protein [Streptomyces nitrosporeus]|uniref:glycerophosphoryl diester phosphodiesterase membrane domain-containing protein n=1 Tax=Streptomyces nitrosporeus TaxID=28894 RepID=UPI001E5BC143|nr:glycerophosphoryl diester phosphodiesterase membrane domain-containing protein [Streptomyces nitrosporeus]